MITSKRKSNQEVFTSKDIDNSNVISSNRSTPDSGIEDIGDHKASDNALFIERKYKVEFLNYPLNEPSSPAILDDDLSTRSLSREDRVALIKELIELYLSDVYLTKDLFLLKHFKKSKDGWISIKFISSYKKLKRTTYDLKEVVDAVKDSSMFELHPDGNKLRRKEPISRCIDKYVPTRMVVLHNLKDTYKNLSALAKISSQYGTITSISLIKPGGELPDNLKELTLKKPELKVHWNALIEFENINSASSMVQNFNGCAWAKELVVPWKSARLSTSSTEPSPMPSPMIGRSYIGWGSNCSSPSLSPLPSSMNFNSKNQFGFGTLKPNTLEYMSPKTFCKYYKEKQENQFCPDDNTYFPIFNCNYLHQGGKKVIYSAPMTPKSPNRNKKFEFCLTSPNSGKSPASMCANWREKGEDCK